MAQYDDIIRNQTEGMRSAFAPLVQHGNNQVTLAALQLQRQQEMQDMAQRNIFAQQLIDRQQHYTKLRDESVAREHMAILREQNRLIGERQAADDERAYRKQVEAEAFRYGVETKGKTTEEITKRVDEKISANVKSDVQRRQDVADQIIRLTQMSSLAAKERVTKMALADPELLAEMSPATIQALRENKTQIADVIAKMVKRGIGNPFIAGVKDATAAYKAYAAALKQATEDDKTLNPDYPLAMKLHNLNNDLAILDKNIAEQYGRIKNVDLAKGIFGNPTAATSQPAAPASPFGMSVPAQGGFPIGIPSGMANPLAGLGLPPERPLSNTQPLPPTTSSVGAVIPRYAPAKSIAEEYGP